MRKLVAIILSCFVVFWIGRIYSINQNPPVTQYYNIEDTVNCGDLQLYFAESHFDNSEDINGRFDVDIEYEDDCKVISIRIDVTNMSESDISWDDVFNFIEVGFESSVWQSAPSSLINQRVNKFYSDSLKPGTTQSVWLCAEIKKPWFKESSWENIDQYDYYYVLALDPHKVAVRLEL